MDEIFIKYVSYESRGFVVDILHLGTMKVVLFLVLIIKVDSFFFFFLIQLQEELLGFLEGRGLEFSSSCSTGCGLCGGALTSPLTGEETESLGIVCPAQRHILSSG